MQADVLPRRPDNGETTGLGREGVYLIGALPHITEQALKGIGGLNMAVHALRKGIKRQQVLFILAQTTHRFRIALSVLGFEGGQLGQRLLFARLLPDANEFSLHLSSLSPGDRIQHMALFMHQTALARGGRKQLREGCQQPLMLIGHDEVELGGASGTQVSQQASPAIFVLLGAG